MNHFFKVIDHLVYCFEKKLQLSIPAKIHIISTNNVNLNQETCIIYDHGEKEL